MYIVYLTPTYSARIWLLGNSPPQYAAAEALSPALIYVLF